MVLAYTLLGNGPSMCSIEYSVITHVWFSVDDGSRAAVSGLKIGDQIVDVNGHSFVDILHAEAVAILKSYQSLILTIKVSYVILYSFAHCQAEVCIN